MWAPLGLTASRASGEARSGIPKSGEPCIIRSGASRSNLGDAVALIAADELRSLLETAHLLRSPKNAGCLLAALAKARPEDLRPMSIRALGEPFGLEG